MSQQRSVDRARQRRGFAKCALHGLRIDVDHRRACAQTNERGVEHSAANGNGNGHATRAASKSLMSAFELGG
jgi:hypothetical protein